MTEDQRDGRMRTVGSVAAALVLRLLVEANKGRPVMTPDGVAGAAKDCGADTQGETSQGATGEGPRFGVEQHRRHIDGTHDPDMASPPCRRVL